MDRRVCANRGTHDARAKASLGSRIGPDEVHLCDSNDRYRNFIDCVLSRKETIAPSPPAHRSITVRHLGDIAMRLGREKLEWGPAKVQILDDAEAAC